MAHQNISTNTQVNTIMTITQEKVKRKLNSKNR